MRVLAETDMTLVEDACSTAASDTPQRFRTRTSDLVPHRANAPRRNR